MKDAKCMTQFFHRPVYDLHIEQIEIRVVQFEHPRQQLLHQGDVQIVRLVGTEQNHDAVEVLAQFVEDLVVVRLAEVPEVVVLGERLALRARDEDKLPPDPRFPKGIVAKILWTHLDLRDAVKAIELAALNHPGLKGAHVFNFAASDIISKEPVNDLLKKFHPKSEIRGELGEFQAPYSSDLFTKTYGYQAQYLFDRRQL